MYIDVCACCYQQMTDISSKHIQVEQMYWRIIQRVKRIETMIKVPFGTLLIPLISTGEGYGIRLIRIYIQM